MLMLEPMLVFNDNHLDLGWLYTVLKTYPICYSQFYVPVSSTRKRGFAQGATNPTFRLLLIDTRR